MEKKITVTICAGTLCYVMGGAELQLLDEHLTPQELKQVEIKGSPCLDCCNKDSGQRAPFVLVDGMVVSEASIPKVVELIRIKLKEE